MKRIVHKAPFTAAILVAALLAASCASVGREFPVEQVPEIRIGETMREEIQALFGSPWRTGLEDGQPTWTYARYRYSVFSDPTTVDLVVRFNPEGIVTSYTFNTTEHDQ